MRLHIWCMQQAEHEEIYIHDGSFLEPGGYPSRWGHPPTCATLSSVLDKPTSMLLTLGDNTEGAVVSATALVPVCACHPATCYCTGVTNADNHSGRHMVMS